MHSRELEESPPAHVPLPDTANTNNSAALRPNPVSAGKVAAAVIGGGAAALAARSVYLKRQPARPQKPPPPVRPSGGPASGLRVVELATVVAAPVVGRTLADWGAEVIKVESAEGDLLRNKIPPVQVDQYPVARESTAGFEYFNFGKASVQLDLKRAADCDKFWALLAGADVFITNTRPAALEKLGLGWEAVRRRCPRLIYAHLSGWGRHGPDSLRAGFDTGPFFTATGLSAAIHGAYGPEHLQASYQYPFGFGDVVTGHGLLAGI